MKYLIAVVATALLAGCAQMGMHNGSSTEMQSGSGMQSPSSGASGTAETEREDRLFHSWIN